MGEEGVIFTRPAADRISRTVRTVESAGGDAGGGRRQIARGPEIRYGKVAEAVSGAAETVELTPVDVNGEELAGVVAVTVRVRWDGASGPVAFGTEAIIPYVVFPLETTSDETRGFLVGQTAGELSLGKPTVLYTSGATITLNPVDAAGVDNGAENVTVQAGWTLPANTNIPTSAIIPFQVAADGLLYVLGEPREVITNMQYDTTSHKIQKKVRADFGMFTTTESSDWVDVTTAVDCTGV